MAVGAPWGHPAFDAAREALELVNGVAGQSDLARRWGLSRQRLTQVVREPGFPDPVGSVGGRPVWLVAEADRWRSMREVLLARAAVPG